MSTGPAPIEGMKRTNVAVRNLERQMEPPRRDPYVMDVNKERNCYNYKGFGYLARNCRNRGTENRIGKGRREEDWNMGTGE